MIPQLIIGIEPQRKELFPFLFLVGCDTLGGPVKIGGH